MYIYSYATTEGILKEINQDSLMIKIAGYKDKEILMAAVCDGIGGLTGGENASSYVISELSDWFEEDYPLILRKNNNTLDARKSIDFHLHRINEELNICCEESGDMGTTLTSILIDPYLDSVLVAHVGDTRLYKIYEDRLDIVTADHSVVAEELRRGLITEEQARNDPRQNQITNCLGAGETGRMYDYIIQKPETECLYMLCSDGFRKMISEDEMIQRLAPSRNTDGTRIKENLEYLMNLNMQRRESDNITALAVRYFSGE